MAAGSRPNGSSGNEGWNAAWRSGGGGDAVRLQLGSAGQSRPCRAAGTPGGGPADPAPGTVRDPVFLHRAGSGATGTGRKRGQQPAAAPLCTAGARTGRGAASEFLRTRQQRLFQFRGHHRCRWQHARRLSQDAHSRRPRLPGEVLLQPRRHRLSGLGHACRPHRRRHLLGPVVSRERAGDGAQGC